MPRPLEPSLPAKMLYDPPLPYTSRFRVTSKTSPGKRVCAARVPKTQVSEWGERVRTYDDASKKKNSTFDRDVDRFGVVGAVKFGKLTLRERVVLGWIEVGSGRLHDRLERALVVCHGLCAGRGGWGSRTGEGTTVEEVEHGEAGEREGKEEVR